MFKFKFKTHFADGFPGTKSKSICGTNRGLNHNRFIQITGLEKNVTCKLCKRIMKRKIK